MKKIIRGLALAFCFIFTAALAFVFSTAEPDKALLFGAAIGFCCAVYVNLGE